MARRPPDGPIREARTCYDHLAGRLGVAVTEALLASDRLARDGDGFVMTGEGERFFDSLGVELSMLRSARRPLLRGCLNWTERRLHLAGSLGAAFAEGCLARGWIDRQEGTRAVALTAAGRRQLCRLLPDIELPG